MRGAAQTARELTNERIAERLAEAERIRGRSLWQDARARFLRNRAATGALIVLALVLLFAVAGPYFAQWSNEEIDWARMGDIRGEGAPSPETGHYFGLDELGRDLYARTIQATRTSLVVGVIGAFVAVVIGTLYGAVSGFAGGWIDNLMMRDVDILVSIPYMFIIILLMVMFERSFLMLFIGIGIVSGLDMSRIVRGQTLALKHREFVEAAHAAGVPWFTIVRRHRRELNRARKDLQIVFQDPLASLDPRMTIASSIAEPLKTFQPGLTRQQRRVKVIEMMERVGLEPTMINRYPHELSGGQNQRVGIARATINRPRLIVCDEAVSALDVSIQAQVVALLKELQAEFGMSMLFISHDLSVVREISHRIMVLYLGRIVELASRDAIYEDARHPYTGSLISAVPVPDPQVERSRERIRLPGGLPSPLDPDTAYRFLPSRRGRGPLPDLREVAPGHWVAEHDPLEVILAQQAQPRRAAG